MSRKHHSEGTLICAGKKYSVVEAELHVPRIETERMLFLEVTGKRGRSVTWFAVWNAELACLDSLAELDGKRLHVRRDGRTYRDDTLGTDIIGWDDERSMCQIGAGFYCLGTIQVDFEHVGRKRYRCHVACTLAEMDDFGQPATRDFPVAVSGVFVVRADEIDPDAHLR